jgi:putative protease
LIKNLELLAPVGSTEALQAAVMNGADAVYLGGKLFNARQYASNFDYEQLMEAVSYAHLRNVSVFVTVNILLDDKEIPDAIDYVKYLYEIGVDGIIVQDIGFAAIVRRIFPKLQVHASTQMTINNLEGAKHLEELGFTRAVLAREVPLSEIERISKNSNIELEVFVHGALCFSYSGQCLMSSLIGGRSGNRGTCAQPCRMEYSIVDKNGNLTGKFDKGYYLSTRDLNTLDQIQDLIRVGVKSFKIEGRMKRPEYVATVVGAYRKAIDGGSSLLTHRDKIDVEQMFNREFTKGLTFGDFGSDFVSVERPDNRGRVVGKVISSKKNSIQVLLYEDVNVGDGLEWDTYGRDRSGTKAQFNGKKDEIVWIDRIKEAALEGSQLRKTSSSELLDSAQKSYKHSDKDFSVDMEVILHIGREPELIMDYNNTTVKVSGDSMVENAIKAPISRDRIYDQLSRLGDTVFSLRNLDLEMDENAFITVKEINNLRRKATEKLGEKIVGSFGRKLDIVFNELKSNELNVVKEEKEKIRLTVRVNNQKQLNQLNLEKVDRIYIGFDDNLKENLGRLKDRGLEAYYWTDKILYEEDLNKLQSVVDDNSEQLDGVSTSNLGTIQFIKDRFNTKLHGDIGLNCFNSYSIDYFRKIGVGGVTLSPELNLVQIRNVAEKKGGELEAIVYGYLPSMITRNCPMAYLKGCKDDRGCKTCQYSEGFMLKDRIGKNFRMQRGNGFTTIYNSVPVMILDRLEDVQKSGVTSFRLDFTFEENISEIQEIYYDYLNNKVGKNDAISFMNEYKSKNEVTNGHFFRGVV